MMTIKGNYEIAPADLQIVILIILHIYVLF